MLLGLWKVVRTRRAVIGLLGPLVAASTERCGPLGANSWQDPYLIGFLSTLIALATQWQADGKLSGDDVGLIQLDAWAELTGDPDPSVGRRIVNLSANRDEAFLKGCRNAAEFHQEWMAGPPHVPGPYDDTQIECVGGPMIATESNAGAFAARSSAAAMLWSRHFESHLDS